MAGEDVVIVWFRTVDDNTWACQVVRTSEYKGLLTVTRLSDGKEILSQHVGLAYDALFGPDLDDVEDWKETCIEAIDNYTE